MTINCLGTLIDLDTPRVMGILNLTPDSFYDGGRFGSREAILKQVEKMLQEGACFIDLGGYSSRPGARHISEEEELERVLPVAQGILEAFPGICLSVDTFRSQVATRCLDLGVAMVNDISAGTLDPGMMPAIAAYRVPYILMHLKGTPQDMQKQTHYTDLAGEILLYFSEKTALGRSLGINDILVDPGFGFSKTREQNYALLQQLDQLALFGFPLLVGLSRKSMVHTLLGGSAETALNGTTALHMYALQKGARILRVHDVKEAVECVALYRELQKKYD